jgi:flagellar biosynthesis/type III secretory pathway protein FliH
MIPPAGEPPHGHGVAMARVLHAAKATSRGVERFDIRGIAEFEDGTPNALGGPQTDAAWDDAGGAPPDPEALRAQVLAEARDEAERKVQEAYEEGYRRGMEAGREAFEESIAQCAEALQNAAQAIAGERAAFLDSVEPEVMSLVRIAVERALRDAWTDDSGRLAQSVREALAVIVDRQRLTVRLHPDDLDALRAHEVTLLEEFPGVEELSLHADAAITPGGCVVESGLMQADVRLETILARMLEALDG